MPEISVPSDLEDEVDKYFEHIYNVAPRPSLSVDEALDILKRYQKSPVERERKVFCRVLRKLFEEHRFFPEYPENKLMKTARLFGAVIEHNLLLNYKALGYALYVVLDALKNSPDSKMYRFGITALDRFKRHLKDLQQYCSDISTIPHYRHLPHYLFEYVEYGKRSDEPPLATGVPHSFDTTNIIEPERSFGPHSPSVYQGQNTTVTATTVSLSYSKLITTKVVSPSDPSIVNTAIAASNSIPVLAMPIEDIIIPSKHIQEKLSFIFNNLIQANIETQCNEIKRIITKQLVPWLSRYLVTKRVSIERNFHTLYSNVLDYFNSEYLNSFVLSETYKYIKVLFQKHRKIGKDYNKSSLKNLGHWLGMITLAKNKPISLDDLDLKMLLVEAHKKGQEELFFIVPFITKVLESCYASTVFGPRSPWTMSLINCLVEIYQEPDLELWLKFEVEILCKSLNIELKDLILGCVLKDPKMKLKMII